MTTKKRHFKVLRRGFVAVPLLLLGVAVLATWIPASRARRIDPADMLRME